jgi:prepilin-type N-terminal cleavage/methylation domain-containing protein
MKKPDIKTNNKGLSILELIVVIAIMSIIGVTLYLATSVATDRHVTSCANKISTAFEQTRNLAMGKQSGYIKFWVDGTGEICAQIYVDGRTYSDQVSIGHSGMTVTFYCSDPSNPAVVTSHVLNTTGCEVEFSRSTGGISRCTYSGSLSSIEVTNGHITKTLEVDSYTGRINVVD